MMPFLFGKRMSRFDAIGSGLASIQLSFGHWLAAIIIVLVGTVISVAGERFTTQQEIAA